MGHLMRKRSSQFPELEEVYCDSICALQTQLNEPERELLLAFCIAFEKEVWPLISIEKQSLTST